MKLGFIGAGNMASAMISGIISSGLAKPCELIVSDCSDEQLERAKAKLGIGTTHNNCEAANSDIVILSIKPQLYPAVIAEISPAIPHDTIVVTIAPGITLKRLEELFGRPLKLVRTMPNTPALVGAGTTAYCCNNSVTKDELARVVAMLDSFGWCEAVPEKLMDAVVGVSGSAPAYVFMLLEAMGDAAVRAGMPRDMAYRFAAHSVSGSAQLMAQTGQHPGALKDLVCSPAGTTIEAVAALERGGFRSTVIDAITECIDKSAKLG